MKNTTKLGRYSRYHFPSTQDARNAMHELEKKFRSMKMKVNEHGTLFCHESGSMNYHLLILSEVVQLGGVEA